MENMTHFAFSSYPIRNDNIIKVTQPLKNRLRHNCPQSCVVFGVDSLVVTFKVWRDSIS